MRRLIFLCLVLFSEVFGHGGHDDGHSYEWEHQVALDPEEKIWVWWTADVEDKTITFKVQSKAKGWSAVGFSPNGGMEGADILYFWLDGSGTPVIKVS